MSTVSEPLALRDGQNEQQEKRRVALRSIYIDSVFDETQTWIWTSDKKSLTFAWVVQFGYGFCWDVPDNSAPFVRAVR